MRLENIEAVSGRFGFDFSGSTPAQWPFRPTAGEEKKTRDEILLVQRLYEETKLEPWKAVLRRGNTELSAKDVLEKTAVVMRNLQKFFGVRRGDLFGISVEVRPEVAVLILALDALGAKTVLLQPGRSSDELAGLLEIYRCVGLMISGEEFSPEVFELVDYVDLAVLVGSDEELRWLSVQSDEDLYRSPVRVLGYSRLESILKPSDIEEDVSTLVEQMLKRKIGFLDKWFERPRLFIQKEGRCLMFYRSRHILKNILRFSI